MTRINQLLFFTEIIALYVDNNHTKQFSVDKLFSF